VAAAGGACNAKDDPGMLGEGVIKHHGVLLREGVMLHEVIPLRKGIMLRERTMRRHFASRNLEM